MMWLFHESSWWLKISSHETTWWFKRMWLNLWLYHHHDVKNTTFIQSLYISSMMRLQFHNVCRTTNMAGTSHVMGRPLNGYDAGISPWLSQWLPTSHNKSIICSCVAGHFSANCSQKALAFAKLWLMASNVRGVTGVTGVTLGRGWSWPAGTWLLGSNHEDIDSLSCKVAEDSQSTRTSP